MTSSKIIKCKTLIVDLNEFSRAHVKEKLVRYGFRTIVSTGDLLEALSNLKYEASFRRPFELIILDINTPNVNFLGFLNEIRNCRPYDNVPIIIVSEQLEITQIEIFSKKGIRDILIKPINDINFIEKLSNKI